MNIHIDLQIACENKDHLPNLTDFQKWVKAALIKEDKNYELTIRIVDPDEIQKLNNDFRFKNKPTNILSFPFESIPEIDLPLLGDLVICKKIIENEAIEQSKKLDAHWAHIVVHGCLHLLGYDHISLDEAEIMESLEIQILNNLGYPSPYYID